MKFLLLAFSILMTGASSANAEQVSLAKAAELGCHRIERLVTLKRIDAAFLEKFYGLKIEKLDSAEAAFRFTGFQALAADGSSRRVEILMDANGKASAHQVTDAAEGNSPAWPQTDPVTLMEYALHYVLENGATKPEVAPFFNNLIEGTLTQLQAANGQTVAQATFKTSESEKVLFVIQGLDGTFISAEVK